MRATRRRPVSEQPALFAADELARTEARASEYVPTPSWVVRALVEGLREAGHPPLPTTGRVIEPAAGEGALLSALQMVCPGMRSAIAWDIRPAACDVLRRRDWYGMRVDVRCGDYLAAKDTEDGTGLWITNPPYSLAEEFWAAMLDDAGDPASPGTVALHVPWAFVATAALDDCVVDLYPIEGRPYAFVRETCWILAGPDRGGRLYRLKKP